MNPGSYIELPKADKRYKPGNIKKDKNGKYRGNPDTVNFIEYQLGPGADNTFTLGFKLNPPRIISNELAEHLKQQDTQTRRSNGK